jgi:hypothetical protein
MNVCALLLTNKRTRTLSAQVYYGCNTFIIERSSIGMERNWSSYLVSTKQIFRYPPFTFGRWVRKLEVHVTVQTRARSIRQLLEPSYNILRLNTWLLLLRPRQVIADYDVAGTRCVPPQVFQADWQTHYSKLNTLKVRLTGYLNLSAEEKQTFYDLPKHATITLRPKSLKIETVQTESHATLTGWSYYRKPDEASQDAISDAVGEMMSLQVDDETS